MKNELENLKHEDLISKLTKSTLDDWVEVYLDKKESGKFNEFVYAIMIPEKWVDTILRHSNWEIDLSFLIPNSRGCFMNWDDDIESIEELPIKNLETFQLPRCDINLIVIQRSYDKLKPDHIEISQNIRHHFNLYDENSGNFSYRDQEGNESIVIKSSNNCVKIRRDILNEYLLKKKLVLVFYVENRRYSKNSLEDLSVNEFKEDLRDEYYHYRRCIMPGDKMTSYQSLGWFYGKKIVFPAIPMPNKKENFQEFIIGTELDGSEIKKTCYPYVDRINFLIEVFFKREVLEKYLNNPEKYTVSDGYIKFADIWGLKIDNHLSEYIIVYLGDLGKDLPEKERNHWLSYNIAPHGRTGSLINYKRSLLCIAVDSDSPDFIFKTKYESFNEQHKDCYGWYLFKPFHKEEYCFKCLSICDDTIESFGSQMNNLDKILIESICTKQIDKHIEPEENERSISKLIKYLKSRQILPHEHHIKNLKMIHELRNIKPHIKGKKFEKLRNKYVLIPGNYRKVFLKILKEAIEFIDYLGNHLIYQKAKS